MIRIFFSFWMHYPFKTFTWLWYVWQYCIYLMCGHPQFCFQLKVRSLIACDVICFMKTRAVIHCSCNSPAHSTVFFQRLNERNFLTISAGEVTQTPLSASIFVMSPPLVLEGTTMPSNPFHWVSRQSDSLSVIMAGSLWCGFPWLNGRLNEPMRTTAVI